MEVRKMKHFWMVLAAAFLLNAGAMITGAQAQGRLVMPILSDDGRLIDQVELYSESYALVIGIDNYGNGWPRLSNAVKDAREVGKAMRAKGFQVTLIENPGKAEITRALEQFFIIKGDDPNARLFLWFAGHGYTENGEGYIIPRDGKAPEAGAGFRLSALSIREVSNITRMAQSKHVLAVFDSCFAGTVFSSSRARPPASITGAVTKPVRQFLTSGDAFQQVSDDGAFRELFLRALNGEERADANDDGYLTASELGLFLTDRVTNLTQGKQTPRYGKLRDRNFDQGDFIFSTPRQASLQTTRSAAAVSRAITADQSALDLAFWNAIKDSTDVAPYEAYLAKFPNGTFQAIARLRIDNRITAAPVPIPPTPTASSAATEITALPPGGSLSGTALDGRWQVKVDVDPGSCRSAGGLFSGNVTIAGGKFSTSFRRAGQRVYLKGDFNDSESRLWGEAELISETVHDFVGTVKVTGDTISKRIRSAPARGCRAYLDITMTRISAN